MRKRKEKTPAEKGRQKERGMITVEAVICLVPFFLVICSFISFTNVYIANSRMELALYKTAEVVSASTYPLYTATGLQKGDQALDERITQNTQNIDELLSNLSNAKGSVEKMGDALGSPDVQGAKEAGQKAGESVKGAAGNVKNVIDDPKSLVRDAFYRVTEYGEEGLKGAFTSVAIGSLNTEFLKDDQKALEQLGIDFGSISYSGSTVFSDATNYIDLHVTYNLKVPYMAFYSKKDHIRVTQELKIPAWANGDGAKVYVDKEYGD